MQTTQRGASSGEPNAERPRRTGLRVPEREGFFVLSLSTSPAPPSCGPRVAGEEPEPEAQMSRDKALDPLPPPDLDEMKRRKPKK